MNSNAYITGVGAFLPGEPIGNDEIETYLRVNARLLRQAEARCPEVALTAQMS